MIRESQQLTVVNLRPNVTNKMHARPCIDKKQFYAAVIPTEQYCTESFSPRKISLRDMPFNHQTQMWF